MWSDGSVTKSEAFQYYDARAAEYDDFYFGRGLSAEPGSETRRDLGLLSPIIGEFGGGRVLDLACGTGFFSEFYGRNSSRIVGVDISPRMLLESRVRYSALCAEACTIRADVFSLPFASGAFDSCFVGFLLSHLDDREILALLGDIKWLMRANGRIAIVDSAWTDFRRKQGRARTSTQTREINDGRKFEIYKRYFTSKELGDLLGRAGLSVCSIEVGQVFLCAVCSTQSECPSPSPS